ncbi:MAG: CheY-like chemotaxis protein [Gammaproteobacteria bacterium]|jgi:CheY-like chemotaxis protein
MLRVSPMTIRNWSVRGWLHAELTAGGHRRYPTREVERFAHERGLTLQKDENDIHRILVVDDDEAFGNFLLASFREHPDEIEARVARGGFEAGHLMHTFSPTIVLLDLVMPGLDGFQVCQLIKNNPSTRSCRVIAMTGYADRGYERRVLEAGAERCLTKPMSLESTFEALGLSQLEARVETT